MNAVGRWRPLKHSERSIIERCHMQPCGCVQDVRISRKALAEALEERERVCLIVLCAVTFHRSQACQAEQDWVAWLRTSSQLRQGGVAVTQRCLCHCGKNSGSLVRRAFQDLAKLGQCNRIMSLFKRHHTFLAG